MTPPWWGSAVFTPVYSAYARARLTSHADTAGSFFPEKGTEQWDFVTPEAASFKPEWPWKNGECVCFGCCFV